VKEAIQFKIDAKNIIPAEHKTGQVKVS